MLRIQNKCTKPCNLIFWKKKINECTKKRKPWKHCMKKTLKETLHNNLKDAGSIFKSNFLKENCSVASSLKAENVGYLYATALITADTAAITAVTG